MQCVTKTDITHTRGFDFFLFYYKILIVDFFFYVLVTRQIELILCPRDFRHCFRNRSRFLLLFFFFAEI